MRKNYKKSEYTNLGDFLADRLINALLETFMPILNIKISFKLVPFKVGFARFISLFLLLSVTFGLSGIGSTNAFFNDTESSSGNTFTAAFLDFYLTDNNFETFIGKEAFGEYFAGSVVLAEVGSLDIQYAVNIEKISGDDDFCNGLDLETTRNGIEVYDADLLSLNVATSTVFGSWVFGFDLPASVTTVGHGDTCQFDVVYTGWRDDTTAEASGFDDEERISFLLKSKMVLMNEMIPNPTGSDRQSGLAGEWVELYNNGDTAIDIAGWSISELSDPSGSATENFYTIVGTTSPSVGEVRTASGSTVISAGGFLVVLFEAQRLNNDGDTVTLYDGSLDQMDQHTYVDGEAPENKSIARIPDGIGIWVDPIPTPGANNIEDSNDTYNAVESSVSSSVGKADEDDGVGNSVEEEILQEPITDPVAETPVSGDDDTEEPAPEEVPAEEPSTEEDSTIEEEVDEEVPVDGENIPTEEVVVEEEETPAEEPVVEEEEVSPEEPLAEEPVVEETTTPMEEEVVASEEITSEDPPIEEEVVQEETPIEETPIEEVVPEEELPPEEEVTQEDLPIEEVAPEPVVEEEVVVDPPVVEEVPEPSVTE